MKELKDKLSVKITSSEQLNEAIANHRHILVSYGVRSPNGRVATPWWVNREMYRTHTGVYTISDVIRSIHNDMPNGMCLHVSTQDKNMVAYTPSREYGEADRQLTTSLSKFLAKHYPCMSEQDIKSMVDEHNAEINVTVMFATTPGDIERIYREDLGGMRGDSACMRYAPSRWGMDQHPSNVYGRTEGISVAYVPMDYVNTSHNCSARAVVYVNPADPSDKRVVRVYGDNPAPLKRLLAEQGYVQRGLGGVKMAKIVPTRDGHPHLDDNTYLMPYIDGPGGDQGSYDGSHCADLGDGYITLLDATTKEHYTQLLRLAAIGNTSAYMCGTKNHTGGTVTVRPMPSMEFTSELTGLKYNMEQGARKMDYYDPMRREVVVCEKSELKYTPLISVRVISRGLSTTAFAPEYVNTFYNRGSVVDTTEAREYLGYKLLDEQLYGTQWALNSETKLWSGRRILVTDTILVIDAAGERSWSHVSTIPSMSKTHVKFRGKVDGYVTLSDRSNPNLAVSAGGTKFDTRYNDDKYIKCVDGKWYAKHGVQVTHYASRKVYAPIAMGLDEVIALARALPVAERMHTIIVNGMESLRNEASSMIGVSNAPEMAEVFAKRIESKMLSLYQRIFSMYRYDMAEDGTPATHTRRYVSDSSVTFADLTAAATLYPETATGQKDTAQVLVDLRNELMARYNEAAVNLTQVDTPPVQVDTPPVQVEPLTTSALSDERFALAA